MSNLLYYHENTSTILCNNPAQHYHASVTTQEDMVSGYTNKGAGYMSGSNIDNIACLINKLFEKTKNGELENVVIFGSSAIALNEINLDRHIDDLDIFVSECDYNKLKNNKNFSEQYKTSKDGQIPYLTPKDGVKIEILKTFPGVIHAEVLKNSSKKENSQNLNVASICDLIKWKKNQGRDKDICDLMKIMNPLSFSMFFLKFNIMQQFKK
ncbi:hypothetical protein RP726_09675 [Candidatus Methylospira mobilis]|uniref:hypothetical protein n=1 Tax=Candidatus Methylospira mobilis TaxID=1808979 RepID=UPI0028E6D315|nr:hypothetical protein [Candidatus Methylospira mobilis]WNV06656.1 hypothetical protein RP726_09675 [Candidatus Methylospira mobilis]